jgi:hypothetical protein
MACLSLEPKTFWCSRCGTISQPKDNGNPTDFHVPKLVERCRQFEDGIGRDINQEAWPGKIWHKLGISESIRTPEERDKP